MTLQRPGVVMNSFEQHLYDVAGVRALDRRAIEQHGISGVELMQRAAAAAWREARRRWPSLRSVQVFCGSGNNGGDGYALAHLAQAEGFRVRVQQVGAMPAGAAARAMVDAWNAVAANVAEDTAAEVDLVVDAIFGIGLTRAPAGEALAAIEAINALHARGSRVLALDVPSGLDADSGGTPGAAVIADLTVSFIAGKRGLHTGRGADLCGAVVVDDLAVPYAAFEGIEPVARLIGADALRHWLPRRGRSAHKGDNGHVLLIGGDHGTPGAILLAARAALRAGAGLVSVATREAHAAILVAAQPELMARGVASAAELAPLLAKADVVAIGPGLGQGDWARSLLDAVLATALPLVVDADALNLLAAVPRHRRNWVLTPHPGEAGRLLGCNTAEVQDDRFAAVTALQTRYGGVIVLKGAGSLVAGEQLRICPFGNPGMGTGGMGDALTGIVSAFIAQRPSLGSSPGSSRGLGLESAAAAAVTAHAQAGDRAAQAGERGLLPSDLIDALRAGVNP